LITYYVLKRFQDDESTAGRCTLHNGFLWYKTALSPQTLFKTEEEARSAIEALKKIVTNSKFKFRIEEVEDE